MPTGIYKRTKEHIVESIKHLPLRGFKHTTEAKIKISEAGIGNKYALGKHHIVSAETIEKIRKSNTGKKRSEEVKRKISERMKGRIGYWCNKKRPEIRKWLNTEEVRKKIGLAKRKEIHKTDESKIARTSIEYRLWREAVFARDNWTCQKCLVKGGKLHPHHIRNFAEEKELRFAIDNGITFCKDCHIKFHKLFGKKNNNLEQIKEFI